MLAVFISAILHLLIFNKFDVFSSFHFNNESQLIQATLVTKVAQDLDVPKATPEKKVVAKSKKAEIKPVAPKTVVDEPALTQPE
ncbi:MAG: hypothetical protein WC733_08770, partial [Methylophilus sp.]